MKVISATRNPAKLSELRRVVGEAAEVAPPPHDISQEFDDIESGATIEEIAAAKAIAWSSAIDNDLPVIASDGGLLIPALGPTWDPTRTRRFAGDAADDLARANALLDLTAHLTGDDRLIGWRESIAIARNGVLLAQWSAESSPGLLASEADAAVVTASGGFWIPALWRSPELSGRLLAELTPEEMELHDNHWRRLSGPVRDWLQSQE
jgi:hypothetical protein